MNKKKNRMGQAARMKTLVRETIVVVIVGVVLLILQADTEIRISNIDKITHIFFIISRSFTTLYHTADLM